MEKFISYIMCCKCCKKEKAENNKKELLKRLTIKPNDMELQEFLLQGSEDLEANVKINKLSDLKFGTSNCVLKHNCNPKEFYEYDEEADKVGEGSFGVVYRVKGKFNRFIRAMKKISKEALQDPNDSSNFIMEIKVMQKLDHPNIIKIYELFEDENNFFIITDYLGEGNLLNKIEAMKHRDEIIVGIIMHQIISAVAYLHKNGVIHGDLKPENIMISSNCAQSKKSFNSSIAIDMQALDKVISNSRDKDSSNRKLPDNKLQLLNMKKFYFQNLSNFQLKLIDFGCSKILTKKKYKFDDVIGTCLYMSPEVSQNKYNEKCDLWSCGVIMFVLFTGFFPFDGDTDKEIEENILNYNFSLNHPEFASVSEEAKSLILKLLTYDPNKRISAMEALNHPFFTKNFNRNNIFNEEINCGEALENMKNFKTGLLFQQFMNGFISYNFISESEINNLRKVFKLLDSNGDGMLSKEEVMKGFKDNKITMEEENLEDFLNRLDNNGNGLIEFEEFIRACSDKKRLLSDENLKAAFDIFDGDRNGFVSKDEIKKTLFENKNLDDKVLDEFLNGVERQQSDYITFEDFRNIMTKIK